MKSKSEGASCAVKIRSNTSIKSLTIIRPLIIIAPFTTFWTLCWCRVSTILTDGKQLTIGKF